MKTENNENKALNKTDVSGSYIHPSLICPYDLQSKYNRCCYPLNKKGNCICSLRHISSSRTY